MFDKVNTSNQNTETHIIASENPNDPFFSKQWHLNIQSNNTDIGFIGYRKYLKDSNYTYKFKKPTVIGVIDVGIFYDYLDLINRIYINSKEIPNNKKDDDNNGYIDDYKGVDVGHPECTLSDINCANAYQDHHGTMMSSIIASETDNNVDIAGIAPDEVKLLPINASYDFKGVDRYIEGYDYLLDMKKKGSDIIGFNISASGEASKIEYDYMKKLADNDILVISSVGNDNIYIDPMNGFTMENDEMKVYPAKYDTKNIVAVGAYDQNGNKASFSNYGNVVHIYLPGKAIIAQPYPELDKLWSIDGTSPAAAVMSGIFSVAKYLYPDCSNIDLRNFVLDKSEKINSYGQFIMKTIKLTSVKGNGLISDGILQKLGPPKNR